MIAIVISWLLFLVVVYQWAMIQRFKYINAKKSEEIRFLMERVHWLKKVIQDNGII